MDHLTRLQAFFHSLFQFDLADLDFGLYRLFRLKQEEIEAFITEQLPREVDAAFAEASAGDREYLDREIERLAQQVRQSLADDAVLPTGEIAQDYANTKLGGEYTEARRKLQAIEVTEGHKAEVFNHLVSFFSRYYEDGDFIPRRRYGSREAYAVPYQGEEVFFHWANRDQHYVKTHERFRDYAFTVEDLTGEYRVRFVIAEASMPKDNTKGSRRYFFPRPDLATYDADAQAFILAFEYRLPTPEEADAYGSDSKAQEAILAQALPHILEAVPDENLRVLLQQDQRTKKDVADGAPELPLLLKRLRHFCRRNTSDYFIHKDLRGFLTRELAFYVKDQVIHLMDLEADLEAKRRVVRTFRRLAERVIDFLAAIEEAQRTLFEKRKFVLRTDYLIPVQHVPRPFWPEVLANQAQLAEWQDWAMLDPQADLFNPAGAVNETFLERHPTLPLHTAHFDPAFVRSLLEALPFDDLDAATDGLLVHGENYQALRLLEERYRGWIKCVYIDPPFNSKTTEILYKNEYKHSSWLSLMSDRIALTRSFLHGDGVFVCAIDENEQERLGLVLEQLLGEASRTCATVVHNPRGIQGTGFSYTNEFAYFVHRPGLSLGMRALASEKAKPLMKTGFESERETAENCFYPIYIRDERVVRAGDVPSDDWHPDEPVREAENGEIEVWPISSTDNKERKWRYARQSFDSVIDHLEVREGRNGRPVIYLAKTQESYRTVWTDPIFNAAEYGSTLLKNIVPDAEFSFPKSVWTIYHSLVVSNLGSGEAVLDYFAGSGTTGHAVINLNREDGGQRRFILVEMAEYFDTVLLPRIAKVMVTPEWKDGQPQRQATTEEAARTPRLVKILRLESYEDALHNLAATAERLADDPAAQQREAAYKALAGEDAYRLRYWIELPLQEAETCLRTLDLAHPFAYSLEVLTDDGPVHKPVDLVETFNYLYGLRVRRTETWHNPQDSDRAYRVVKATDREGRRRILVIWRDAANLDPGTERAFLENRIAGMAEGGEVWDEMLINGDSPTPGVSSLDPLFKQLMMAGEAA